LGDVFLGIKSFELVPSLSSEQRQGTKRSGEKESKRLSVNVYKQTTPTQPRKEMITLADEQLVASRRHGSASIPQQFFFSLAREQNLRAAFVTT
jgi:hypothetical protein